VGDAAAARRWIVRDLWTGAPLPDPVPDPGLLDARLTFDVPSHGVRWVALDPV